MEIIIALLTFILITLCLRLFFLDRAINNLAKDITSKRVTQSNLLTTTSTSNKSIKNLVTELNLMFSLLSESYDSEIKEKERFKVALHNITHDIRTPLTISWGYIQQLIKESNQNSIGLNKVESNIKLVSKRLEVLLEFQALLEKQDLELEKIELTALLKNSLLKYYDQLNNNNFEVELDLPDYLIFINGNSVAIERIIQNILGNVLKHGKETLSVKLLKKDNKIKLIVKNKSQNSIKQINRLIDRFYSENLSQLETSSGLGLYIVKEIVESMDGDLSLSYTEPYFTLTLEWDEV
ncbi:sensor histidine kinase [Lactococcus petauri]|uniref:sensor histidine kinase n=1 Tax=Lactococcus petauri TaxID=1940789 RepID=UPI00254ED0A7|nr:HAMP domain-containing sensor histidine kinase [Lactococcus petauri]